MSILAEWRCGPIRAGVSKKQTCVKISDVTSSPVGWMTEMLHESGRALLTVGVGVLAQLCLGLPVGSVAGFVRQAGRHGGGGDHGLEGALPLLHVELRVEDDDVDFGHVEHPEGHGRAQVHGDGQRGRLDVELKRFGQSHMTISRFLRFVSGQFEH